MSLTWNWKSAARAKTWENSMRFWTSEIWRKLVTYTLKMAGRSKMRGFERENEGLNEPLIPRRTVTIAFTAFTRMINTGNSLINDGWTSG